jgi:hypothetical protein
MVEQMLCWCVAILDERPICVDRVSSPTATDVGVKRTFSIVLATSRLQHAPAGGEDQNCVLDLSDLNVIATTITNF